MEKKWYTSKAMWAGLALLGYGAFTIIFGYGYEDGFVKLMEGLGFVGIRQALD